MLEHLLSEERLSAEASAGAVNAMMLAAGLARGGREEAQKRLADFGRAVNSNGNLPALQRVVMERLLSFTPLEGTLVQAWFDAWSRRFSRYDINPLNINPLKDLIERFVDFEALRAYSDLLIFISATNVQTGRVCCRGTGRGQYRRINAHRIVLEPGTHFDSIGKLSTDYDYFEVLCVSGMRAARRFLDDHFDAIAVRSTVDLRTEAQAEWA